MKKLLITALVAAIFFIAPLDVLPKKWPNGVEFLQPTLLAQLHNPHGYILHFCQSNASPADSTTYYFGTLCYLGAAMSTTDTPSTTVPITIPYPGSIRHVGYTNLITTPGGATTGQFANLAINRNAGTFSTISTSSICAAAACRGSFTFTGFTIPLGVNDSVNIRFIAPAYTDANPTGVYSFVYVMVVLS